jgi:hypothetical protein
VAKACVKGIRVAREVPCLDGMVKGEVDRKWSELCGFLKTELTGLRTLDLTIWPSSGETTSFPVSAPAEVVGTTDGGGDWDQDAALKEKIKEEELKRWREWEWTHDLLQMDALRQAKITWWGFQNIRGQSGEGSFDSWLAGRMVGERLVKERMVREGAVEEGVVVLRGLRNELA